MPKVSVIIPNYNHVAYLEKRITSVLTQTYQDFEIILMDDCSTDNSREVIEMYAKRDNRIHLVFNQINSGNTFKQWNKGVKLAKGEYIWIAESDDYAHEDFLDVLVKKLDANPDAGLVFSQSYVVDEYSNNLGILTENIHIINSHLSWDNDFKLVSKNHITSLFVECNFISNASSVLFRKSIFEMIGKADQNYVFTGDWHMWLRFGLNSPICYSSQPLNYYRFHSNNVRTKSKKNQYYEFFKIMYFIYRINHLDLETKNKAKNKMLLYRKKCLEYKDGIGYYKMYEMTLIVYLIGYSNKCRKYFRRWLNWS